jgi:anti-sigma regulatory factor (Ser/Thr protein kinase)
MSPIADAVLLRSLSADALLHGSSLPDVLAGRHGLSRRAIVQRLNRLAAAGWLVKEGTRRPRWQPGALRQVSQRYPLHGLQEHLAWQRDFAPVLDLPDTAGSLAEHAFTELVNNAVDHSGGRFVDVSLRRDGQRLQLLVADDGCGVFARVRQTFGIEDAQEALLELGKGRLTTQPDRHLGQGLFFTSRLADLFDLHANGLTYQHRLWQRRDWLRQAPQAGQGTVIFMSVALDTPLSLAQVMAEHGRDGLPGRLARTVVPLRLLSGPQHPLLSRSQGRRVVTRLTEFLEAELDFEGVPEIGHAFADEVFRVFAQTHPQVRLSPRNMAPGVARVIDAVRAGA